MLARNHQHTIQFILNSTGRTFEHSGCVQMVFQHAVQLSCNVHQSVKNPQSINPRGYISVTISLSIVPGDANTVTVAELASNVCSSKQGEFQPASLQLHLLMLPGWYKHVVIINQKRIWILKKQSIQSVCTGAGATRGHWGAMLVHTEFCAAPKSLKLHYI